VTRLAHLAFLLAAFPLAAAPHVRVLTADGRASLRIIGSNESSVRTSAAVATREGVVVVTAPAGKGVTDVVVPRTSVVEIRAGSGHAFIENVAAVSITKPSGELEVRGVAGSVAIQMTSGNATVHDAGSVAAVTSTANLEATNVRGDVTVTSINGRTTLSCVAGSVSVTDTNGVIALNATRGDVTVNTTSGRASWTGVPLSKRRYELKTLSGVVTFHGAGPLEGAAISLSTHAGRLSTNIALPNRKRDGRGRVLRVWSSGSGAQITLDAFDGNVELEWNEKGDEDEDCTGTPAVDRHERRNSGARSHGG
jgi:hypothetical protein